ncbi:MAG: lipoate--protein ligase family protein [Rhodospirillales bacterium]|nr:MAG: lipoate--protein ligase family protein [Rhodospirillales bacterium]
MDAIRVVDCGVAPPARCEAQYHGLSAVWRPGDRPIVALARPSAPYLCVGASQDPAVELDLPLCRARGWPVFRRALGGGAIYLDGGQQFFHFILPRRAMPRDPPALYARLMSPALAAFGDFGVAASFAPPGDLRAAGRKIGGVTAGIVGEALVVGSSFIATFDTAAMADAIAAPSPAFRAGLRKALDDNMTTLSRLLDPVPALDAVKVAFLRHLQTAYDAVVEPSTTTAPEDDAIAAYEARLSDAMPEVEHARRLTPGGVRVTAGRHLTEAEHRCAGGLIRVRLLEHDGRIEELTLGGDAARAPEDRLAALATALVGCRLDDGGFGAAVERELDRLDVTIDGVDGRDVARAVEAAYAGARRRRLGGAGGGQ